MDNPEATTDSTPTDDSVPMDTSQTEEALLADIIRNSDFVDTLPDEQVPQLDAEDSDEEDPDTLDEADNVDDCLLYTSPSPRDRTRSRMPSSA